MFCNAAVETGVDNDMLLDLKYNLFYSLPGYSSIFYNIIVNLILFVYVLYDYLKI